MIKPRSEIRVLWVTFTIITCNAALRTQQAAEREIPHDLRADIVTLNAELVVALHKCFH